MAFADELGLLSDPTQQTVYFYWKGEWVAFPLVPGSVLQRQPMSPFSPAIQSGDSTRVLDRRMNVTVWDDWSGGMGERRADIARGLNNYQTATLDARTKGYLVLPAAYTQVSTVGASLVGPVHIERLRDGGGTALFLWSESYGEQYVKDGAGAWTAVLPGLRVLAFAAFGNAFYASTYGPVPGIKHYVSTNRGVTWTAIAGTGGFIGLEVHDGALWSVNYSDGRLYKSLDGTTWTIASSSTSKGAVKLLAGETFRQVFAWTSPAGPIETLFITTDYNRMFVFEEEIGEIHTIDSMDYSDVFDARLLWTHVWRRNNFAYLTPYDAADPNGLVLAYNGGTVDEVGPRGRGGLPENWFHSFTHTVGNVHELFGFGRGGTVNGIFSYGAVMSMNDEGSWHTVVAGEKLSTGGNYIVGGGYGGQTIYVAMSDGKVYQVANPDRRMVLPQSSTTFYDTQTHYLISSEQDMGLRNVWKIGAYFLLSAELADGTPGVPIGSTVKLYYRADGGPWVQLPVLGAQNNNFVGLLSLQSLAASSVVWPVIMVLPDGVTQQGVAFKKLQWKLELARSGAQTSPAITELSLYHTLWLEKFYAFSFNVDLREETFAAYPDATYEGRSREELQDLLREIEANRGYVRFRYGAEYWQQEKLATDMLVTYRDSPNTVGSIATVSVRDLTAPTA